MMRHVLRVSLLAVLAASPVPVHGTPFRLVLDLLNPTPSGEFAQSVAAFENRVVVGTADCGVALLFDAATGAFIRSLGERGLLCARDNFGTVVSAGGQRVAVGSRFEQRVYVFDADGRLERVLSPPDPELDDNVYDNGFGTSLAVAERLVVVGGSRTGVYVFDASTGDMRFRLEHPGAGRDAFGAAVAFTAGNVIVVDPQVGIVFGFDGVTGHPTWRHSARIRASRVVGFGGVLAADAGHVAVLGFAERQRRNVVLVLDATTGFVRHRYREPRPGSGFGAALALRGNALLVGAPLANEEKGIAYLYRLGRPRRVAAFRAGGERTGDSVALSEDRVVVSSPRGGQGRVAVFAPSTRRP